MHTLHPIVRRVGISSPFSLCTVVMLDFLGTTWVGLTQVLSDIGYMMPACSSFKTYALTTSCICGFSLLCGCLTNFASSSKYMWWVQNFGLMPFKSDIIHLRDFLFCLRTCSRLSSCAVLSRAEMTTGHCS